MSTTEKAVNLLEKMYDKGNISVLQSKRCALIAVNLLIESTPSMNIYPPNLQTKHPRVREYWQDVKQEIEKL